MLVNVVKLTTVLLGHNNIQKSEIIEYVQKKKRKSTRIQTYHIGKKTSCTQ